MFEFRYAAFQCENFSLSHSAAFAATVGNGTTAFDAFVAATTKYALLRFSSSSCRVVGSLAQPNRYGRSRAYFSYRNFHVIPMILPESNVFINFFPV